MVANTRIDLVQHSSPSIITRVPGTTDLYTMSAQDIFVSLSMYVPGFWPLAFTLLMVNEVIWTLVNVTGPPGRL